MLPARAGGDREGLGAAKGLTELCDRGQINIGDRLLEAQLALHPARLPGLPGLHERQHHATPAGSRGAARPVEVGLVVLGGVEMDDGADALDVDSPGGNVGRDQRLDPAGRERCQRSGALVLAASAVDRRGHDSHPFKLAGQPIAAVTGPAEDDRGPGRADRVGCHLNAPGAGDGPEQVVSRDHVGSLVADLAAHRVVLVVAGERRHIAVERGREQHRLRVRRGLVEQAPHSRDESHVGHAVGLVNDNHLHRVQADHALLDQVLKASGARHQDVDAPAKGLDLVAVAHAAVDDSHADAS